jgi:hypothetical protein
MSAKKLAVGDLIEIPTRMGLAYALYTHHDMMYGSLLRVWNDKHKSRPTDFKKILDQPVSFSCFFPLAATIRRKTVSVVDNFVVPELLQKFPVFRSGLPDPVAKKVLNWWLWDGENSWSVGAISEEERKLPIRGTCNDTMLIQRIETNWTSEKDPR